MIFTTLQVALGGALGATGRYLTGIGMARLLGTGFPYATLTANIIGSFIMGVAFVFLITREAEASRWVPFVMTGILGGCPLCWRLRRGIDCRSDRGYCCS